MGWIFSTEKSNEQRSRTEHKRFSFSWSDKRGVDRNLQHNRLWKNGRHLRNISMFGVRLPWPSLVYSRQVGTKGS